ncbi:MAG TPA: hypothetical protein VJ838_14865 [Gaiellaceae bacterium]|jgi:hypothetical protein|nr:hypothetical protein [Gaiellaceae bacterium]
MSVIMTMVAEGDPAALERYAAEHVADMQEIKQAAVERGLIAHRFYGTDGQIMVSDEWPDEQSFITFFEEMGPKIGPMMEAVGITSEPHPIFWRKLETHDDHGWDA